MCSCAWPLVPAFAGLLLSPALKFGEQAGSWTDFVLVVDMEEEQWENPALLAHTSQGICLLGIEIGVAIPAFTFVAIIF